MDSVQNIRHVLYAGPWSESFEAKRWYEQFSKGCSAWNVPYDPQNVVINNCWLNCSYFDTAFRYKLD